MTTQFVLSAEESLDQSYEILVCAGYQVLRGDDVSDVASETLADGGVYIVISHGSKEGTIVMHRNIEAREWMGPSMQSPPTNSRIYLYACHVGKLMVPFLSECEAFGHIDAVPIIETHEENDYINRFIKHVFELVSSENYCRDTWQRILIEIVNEWWIEVNADVDDGSECPVSMEAFNNIHVLRRSLNFGKPMWG